MGAGRFQTKVLYLLHGLSDDASAWQRYSSIETLAAAYGLVVVMPSVGRSFYVDQPNGQQYFTYLTEELPQYLADVFGLALAGKTLSSRATPWADMALSKQRCCTRSVMPPRPAFLACFLSPSQDHPDDPRRPEFALLFGDLGKLSGSEHDPAVWLQRAAKNPTACPVCSSLVAGRRTSIR